jgi:hypothetical protein
MRARVTTALLTCILLCGVACSKPSQMPNRNSSANPDNSQPNQAPAAEDSSQPAATDNSGQSAPAAPDTVTVPANKVLTVRLSDDIGSKISQPGASFAGTLARPVEIDGKTVISAGARVEGVVVDAKPMGHFKGGALLELRLESIRVDGERLPLQTATFTQTLKGKGQRTGILAGGGAGLGALIGGLAGGGKGAAIGAVTGAGAGTAGAAYTGNKEILLPAESAVAFTLKEPLKIRR